MRLPNTVSDTQTNNVGSKNGGHFSLQACFFGFNTKKATNTSDKVSFVRTTAWITRVLLQKHKHSAFVDFRPSKNLVRISFRNNNTSQYTQEQLFLKAQLTG